MEKGDAAESSQLSVVMLQLVAHGMRSSVQAAAWLSPWPPNSWHAQHMRSFGELTCHVLHSYDKLWPKLQSSLLAAWRSSSCRL